MVTYMNTCFTLWPRDADSMPLIRSWIALGALLLANACSDGAGAAEGAAGGGPPPEFQFPVTFAEVVAGEVVQTAELVGDVVSARYASLAFERAGRIETVAVDLGAEVAAGAELARLDDRVLAAQLQAAQAAAEEARVEAAFAARGVTTSASDWLLDAGQTELQRQLLAGWAGAAQTMAPDDASGLDGWLKRRLALVEQGRSRLRVGHRDLAA